MSGEVEHDRDVHFSEHISMPTQPVDQPETPDLPEPINLEESGQREEEADFTTLLAEAHYDQQSPAPNTIGTCETIAAAQFTSVILPTIPQSPLSDALSEIVPEIPGPTDQPQPRPGRSPQPDLRELEEPLLGPASPEPWSP